MMEPRRGRVETRAARLSAFGGPDVKVVPKGQCRAAMKIQAIFAVIVPVAIYGCIGPLSEKPERQYAS
jgi:hypothetical protein